MKKFFMIFVVFVSLGLIFWSCSGDDDPTEPTNQAPSCEIATPVANSVYNIGEIVPLLVNAEDSDGEIIQVSFYLDSAIVDSTNIKPYNTEIATSNLSIGNHLIKVIVVDNSDAFSEIEIPFSLQLQSPSNFQLEQNNINTFTLNWVNNNPGAEGTKIERKIDDGSYIEIASVTSTTYVDSNFFKGPDSIFYQIRAFRGIDYSDYISHTNLILFPEPTNVVITQTSYTTASLQWTDNSIGEDKFVIERKNSAGIYYGVRGEIIGDDSNEKTWNDTVLIPNKEYDYRIRAVKDENFSSYATTTYNNTFVAPSNLAYTLISPTSISLNWIDNSKYEEGFIIDRKVGEYGTWVTDYAIIDSNLTTWVDNTYDAFTLHYYRIRSYYGSYFSEYTTELQTTPIIDDMISIPSGNFTMGPVGEQVAHSVSLTNNFYMDKFEVTNQEYCDMLNYANELGLLTIDSVSIKNNTGTSKGLLYIGSPDSQISYDDSIFFVDSGLENRPVTLVSWYGGAFFCNMLSRKNKVTELYNLSDWSCNYYGSMGYRLPTAAEWEYTARYNDGRIYPWGSSYINDTYCNYNSNVGHTVDVDTYYAFSQLRLSDLAGNVWEWTGDKYEYSYYQDCLNQGTVENPTGPNVTNENRLLCGGAWNSNESSCHTTNRIMQHPTSFTYNYIGFRAVLIP